MNTKIKKVGLISKNCGSLNEIIKFKNLHCNFSLNIEKIKKNE